MTTARFQWGEPPWPRAADVTFTSNDSISSTPDVAIIGAGLTGTSTALHLARRGIRSIVYEAGLVADGASDAPEVSCSRARRQARAMK